VECFRKRPFRERILRDVIGFDVNDCYIHAQGQIGDSLMGSMIWWWWNPQMQYWLLPCQNQPLKKSSIRSKLSNRREAVSHKKSAPALGTMETIDRGNGFYVRRITVRPGITFSFLSAPYASLRLDTLDGVATLTIGEETSKDSSQ